MAPLRVCIDLNIWVARQLTRHRGRTSPTAAETIAVAVETGRCSLGEIQLIVSWSMLSRLASVLRRKHVPETAVDMLVDAIAGYAALGPATMPPHVVLGGGVEPIRDLEDAGVLDAAVAGRADFLVTRNLRDFANYHVLGQSDRLARGSVLRYPTAGHSLMVAHPEDFAHWINTGRIVLPDHPIEMQGRLEQPAPP